MWIVWAHSLFDNALTDKNQAVWQPKRLNFKDERDRMNLNWMLGTSLLCQVD